MASLSRRSRWSDAVHQRFSCRPCQSGAGARSWAFRRGWPHAWSASLISGILRGHALIATAAGGCLLPRLDRRNPLWRRCACGEDRENGECQRTRHYYSPHHGQQFLVARSWLQWDGHFQFSFRERVPKALSGRCRRPIARPYRRPCALRSGASPSWRCCRS